MKTKIHYFTGGLSDSYWSRPSFRLSGLILLLGSSLLVPITVGATKSSMPMAVEQQTKKITGTVTDNSGEPIIGATVAVKGTKNATVTDVDGHFTLSGVTNNAVLRISYIGYSDQEIGIGKQSTISIVLSQDTKALDEVVVVAYGAQKKTTLTGAVAAIGTRELKQSPAANLAVTLTGRLPGLIAIQRSGEPGRDVTNLYMRGRGTINGQNPLILVDGVERDITSLDPNEVDNVSILKDASSTALFGVRGANGVILVTTKRGTSEIPDISLTAETGWQTFTRWPSQIDSYDWALLKNQAWHNDHPNPGVTDAPPYSAYALERYRLGDQPNIYSNHHWVDELTNKWVPQTRYNLTLNGKGANVNYFVNVGYLHQGGQFKLDKSEKPSYDAKKFMDRYNFRANLDVALNARKTLKAFLNAAGTFETVNGPNEETLTLLTNLLGKWPNIQAGPTTPDGQVLLGGSSYQYSPWAQINRSGYRKETRSSVNATFGMSYDLGFLLKGLSTKLTASYDTQSINYLVGKKGYQYWESVVDPNRKNPDGSDYIEYHRIRTDYDNTPLSTSKSATFASFYDLQWQINFNRTFNEKHTVTALLLAQKQSQIKASDVLPFNVQGLATRLTYAYDDKYIAEFNAGYNGSEQFAPKNRYGFFPSASAAWNISREKFFEKWTNVVDKMKLRVSYGLVGNDKIGNTRFLYLDNVARSYGGYSPSLSNNNTIQELFFGNPNLKWETAKKLNVGFELGLWKYFNLSFDIFSERRDNILITKNSTPSIIGVARSTIAPFNLGRVKNRGYELEMSFNKTITKDLLIMAKANLNYNDNEVVYMDELKFDETYAYPYHQTGYSIGQQWGMIAEGFFKDQDEINAYAKYEGQQPRPGDLKYKDVNGDNIINQKDLSPIGYSDVPKYTAGLALSITYKNFDISALFQGAFNVSGAVGAPGPYEWYDFREFHKKAWTAERAAAGEEILFPALALAQSPSEIYNSTFFNMDRSYIRLKNLEIGYTLPKNWSRAINAKVVRFYVNGYNLATWDKMKFKDWDPEVMDNSTYPLLKVWNIGLNVTF